MGEIIAMNANCQNHKQTSCVLHICVIWYNNNESLFPLLAELQLNYADLSTWMHNQ